LFEPFVLLFGQHSGAEYRLGVSQREAKGCALHVDGDCLQNLNVQVRQRERRTELRKAIVRIEGA
jgi:hypothetical protein